MRSSSGLLRRLFAAAFTGVALAGGLSACSSSAPAATTKTTLPRHVKVPTGLGTGSAAPPKCSSVSAATVDSTLGVSVRAPYGEPRNGAVTCSYLGTGHLHGVTVYYDADSTLSLVEDGPGGAPDTKRLHGLGEAAFAYTSGPEHTVVALQGKLEVSVTSIARVQYVEALVRRILPSS